MTEPSILYLSPGVFDKGGVSRYCRYQVNALRELCGSESVEVHSLLPPDEHAFEQPFSVSFASFGPTRRGKFLLALAAGWSGLRRPRVIWAAHLHLAPLALALGRLVGAAVVVNVYGLEVWTGLTKVRAFALRSSDFVLSDCHSTFEHMLRHGLRAPAGTSVHWDCVDTDRFTPGLPGNVLEKYGVAASFPGVTVLTLARLSGTEAYKGGERLLAAMTLLRDRPVRLVVAGGGAGLPNQRRAAADLGLGDRCAFTGRVSEADLVAVYRSADVFALLTTKGPGQGEGLPLTPIEAAACGKPILVGNEDGSVEAVEDAVTGFAIDPRNVSEIARVLALLQADDVMRARLGAAGRERILREMSYGVFRARLEQLLPRLGLRARQPER